MKVPTNEKAPPARASGASEGQSAGRGIRTGLNPEAPGRLRRKAKLSNDAEHLCHRPYPDRRYGRDKARGQYLCAFYLLQDIMML